MTVRPWDLMLPRPSRVLVTNPDRQLPCHFSKTVLRIPSKRELPVFRCLHDEPAPPAIGKLAFAQRSGATKAPVGLLSGSAVCNSRWRGVAPTSATPTRLLRKCRRIEEVKSRMDRKFSRIENLRPRDGSCPLPLRSKRIFNKCF